MANCLVFLGDLTPGYLRQHRALPKIASLGRHCDSPPRRWILYICYRALVRSFSHGLQIRNLRSDEAANRFECV